MSENKEMYKNIMLIIASIIAGITVTVLLYDFDELTQPENDTSVIIDNNNISVNNSDNYYTGVSGGDGAKVKNQNSNEVELKK